MKKLKTQTSTNPLFFFSLFFLFNHSVCLDPWFESCVPKDCGDGLNITYPFFINDLQNSSCGYPGFELNCHNGSSMIRISENNFIIKHINTKTRMIRLQNAAFLLKQTESCPSRLIRNLTLDPTRFVVDNNTTTQIVLMADCKNTVPNDLEKYRIESCGNSMEFVMAANDENLSNVSDGCGKIVETPAELVDGDEEVDGGNYMEAAERGFLMRWFAADCGVCEQSGGRCGFDMAAFQVRCLCADRPHKVSCKPGYGLREVKEKKKRFFYSVRNPSTRGCCCRSLWVY